MIRQAATMLPAAMRPQEYERLRELVEACRPKHTLEIGMANGGSAVTICAVLQRLGGGRHVAIDPFQTAENGWAGRGLQALRASGVDKFLELIEEFGYLALPRLVREGRRFDFILIDGWHSFDYTLIDVFYSDLLLADGGILAIHDTAWPAVYRACRFIETHKPYDRIGPPISRELRGLLPRLGRRVTQILCGPTYFRQMVDRREQWFSLAAYRKRHSHQVADDHYVHF
jgi:predicted O-methyltransferase YrrM